MDDKGTLGILVIISGILGAAATKAFEWWTTRDKTKYEQTVQQRKDAIAEYQELLERTNARVDALEKRNDECEKRNDRLAVTNAALERQQAVDHARIEYLEEALTKANIPFRKSGIDTYRPLPNPNEDNPNE